jgi:hypothetical protein
MTMVTAKVCRAQQDAASEIRADPLVGKEFAT